MCGIVKGERFSEEEAVGVIGTILVCIGVAGLALSAFFRPTLDPDMFWFIGIGIALLALQFWNKSRKHR
jgi:hypothetical protein